MLDPHSNGCGTIDLSAFGGGTRPSRLAPRPARRSVLVRPKAPPLQKNANSSAVPQNRAKANMRRGPFPCIADHVVKFEVVGRIATDGREACVSVLARVQHREYALPVIGGRLATCVARRGV